MHLDAANVARLFQAEVRPRLPPVRGAVDPVAPGGALAVVLLAGAGPYDLSVRRRKGHIAERAHQMVVEEGLPGGALVRRLLEAARGGGRIDRGRVAGPGLHVVNPSAGDRRADAAELKITQRIGGDGGGLLGVGRGQ